MQYAFLTSKKSTNNNDNSNFKLLYFVIVCLLVQMMPKLSLINWHVIYKKRFTFFFQKVIETSSVLLHTRCMLLRSCHAEIYVTQK